MKKLLLSSLLTLSFSFAAVSQCTPGYAVGTSIGNNSTGWLWGQSFTATCGGTLNYVEFISTGTGTVSAGTLTIYDGDSVSTSIHTQSHPAITVANIGDPMRIYITGSVPITNGNQYTFEFQVNNVDTKADWNNGYAGGTSYQAGNPASVDFAFNASITTITGVEEIISSDVNVFPNPTLDNLNITIEENIEQLSIYSINGRLVKTINENVKSINVSDLSEGMYVLVINTKNGIIRKRFIKE
jgi:hypothetical protein